MSDRHLYKAKRKDNGERNGEWVEGYYFCMGHNDGRHVHHFIIPLGADLSKGRAIDDIQVEVDPSTLCQCTGLRDKNNKLIWENDMVKRIDLHDAKEPSIGIIEYDTENTAFVIHWVDVVNYSPTYPWKDKIEVIGSIFDNLEMLEVGE